MPASIRKAYKQMNVSILQAEHLPKMDMFGTIDAYVETTFMKHKYKTKAINPQKSKCVWNEQFKMPLQWPISNDRFVLGIWDKDDVNDEKVGSIVLSIKELVRNCSKEGGSARWVNIYGAPKGLVEGPHMKKMNNNPEQASTWKGRILLHIEVFDSKSPQKGQVDLNKLDQTGILAKCKQDGVYEEREYQIQVEFGSGICLPKSSDYRARLSIGNFFIDSDKPKGKIKGTCNNWFHRSKANMVFKSPCQSLEELDRVYVYLLKEDKAICYWRGKVSDFSNFNP